MPLDFGDILAAAASIGGAYIGREASESAADVQAQAARQGADITQSMFDQTRADTEPWRKMGEGSLYTMGALTGVDYPGAPGTAQERAALAQSRFEKTPGYGFRMSEGLKAIDSNLGARGMRGSGAADKARMRYAQGLAGDEYGNYYNRLANLAGLGQATVGTQAQTAATAAGALGRSAQEAGQATASGYVGGANAVTNALNNLLYYYGARA